MKKIKLLTILLLLVCMTTPCDAKWFWQKKKEPVKQVEKPVTYTVETAKETAFKNVSHTLPQSEYKAYLKDNLFSTNIAHIRSNILCANTNNNPRNLFPSYCGRTFVSYGIRYHKNPERVWFYGSTGKLLRFEVDNNMKTDIFPRTSLTYNNKGNLSNVTFYVSKSDQYNFDGNGNLIIHWVGTKAYNRSGQLMRITREL